MKKVFALVLLALIVCSVQKMSAQTTEFTYQGSLRDGVSVANGNYDFEFKLFDLASGGVQQGSTIQRLNVAVANGIFTVSLDFGAGTLPGADRFLEIGLRVNGNPGGFQQLLPRQKLASSPYSVKSLNSALATNATQLDGVAASQYVVTTDPRMTDARPPTAGSANYIQNGVTPQASSDFNISGTGTANIFNAATQYNIGANRVLSVAGSNNIFAGVGAGQANTTGFSNAFFGTNAGLSNTTGVRNSFFGTDAGRLNTMGGDNAFFGFDAGEANTTGVGNAFFGTDAGLVSTTGSFNAFFGRSAGRSNTTGGDNAFFGTNAGHNNMGGNGNAFFGRDAGFSNTTGVSNAFFGTFAGSSNTTGNNNTFFGRDAGRFNTASSNAFFGAFAGDSNTTGLSNAFFGALVGQANTIGSLNAFFGALAGQANTMGGYNAFFGASAGQANTTGGNNTFFGALAGYSNTTGANNSFFGTEAGRENTTGTNNAFFGRDAGLSNTTGNSNAFFGRDAGFSNTTGTNNTIIGVNTNVGANSLTFATAIGSNAVVTFSSQVQLGRDGSDTVRIGNLAAATATQLCIDGLNVLAACSSSRRYKENIRAFSGGMNLVRRLQPVAYDWIENKNADLGLIAEDVAKVEPLLVTHNNKGEIQGVKYDQLTVVLINAVKEQQKQIETLTQALCSLKPDLEVCKK